MMREKRHDKIVQLHQKGMWKKAAGLSAVALAKVDGFFNIP